MALFGDLGKFIGLGSAKETAQGAFQGALRGALVGQPFMGAAQGALSARPGPSETGQSVAVSISDTPPRESAMSGEVTRPVMQPSNISYSPGIQPAIMRTPMVPSGRSPMQAGLPAIVGGGVSAGRGIMNMLGIAGGAITVAPIIIDPFTGV